MKFSVFFLVFGAALAVPQNFYWSFSPKSNDQETFDPKPTLPKSRYNWIPFGGHPLYADYHLVRSFKMSYHEITDKDLIFRTVDLMMDTCSTSLTESAGDRDSLTV
jgi:hypothetical protein